MTPPVVSGAQGDGGRMDDETLTTLEAVHVTHGLGHRQTTRLLAELRATRRELGDTRARLAAACQLTPPGLDDAIRKANETADHYGIDRNVAHIIVAQTRAALAAALGATDQAGDGG